VLSQIPTTLLGEVGAAEDLVAVQDAQAGGDARAVAG
jgi:hypothetical protein